MDSLDERLWIVELLDRSLILYFFLIQLSMIMQSFQIGEQTLTGNELFFILGPCVIETEEFTYNLAKELKLLALELDFPFIFKASFDKANRSSIHSKRGPGLQAGARILKKIRQELNIPVMTDIHEPWQAEAIKESVSALQIPAFLSRQTDLLVAAAKTGLPLNIKKAQFMSAQDMGLVVEKIHSVKKIPLMLTERGTFFGYHNLVVDIRNIPLMKKNKCPVIIDATHSVQRPAAEAGYSGGDPEFIPIIAKAGVVAGANGVFLEVHPKPQAAWSDGTNVLNLSLLRDLIITLKKLFALCQ
jgi:2-dehydro-3-deoxyphosphooctonate aldolase (KDO 8-P synthase)